MSGIIFDNKIDHGSNYASGGGVVNCVGFKSLKDMTYQEEIAKLKSQINEYQQVINIQYQRIAKLDAFIDETNELMKKELDIVRGEG